MPRYKDLGTFIRDIARVGLFCSVPLVVVIMYLHSPVQSLCHPVFGCAPAVFDFCWFGFGCHAHKALSGTAAKDRHLQKERTGAKGRKASGSRERNEILQVLS